MTNVTTRSCRTARRPEDAGLRMRLGVSESMAKKVSPKKPAAKRAGARTKKASRVARKRDRAVVPTIRVL